MLSGTTIPILITGEFSDIIPVFFIYYGASLLFGIFLLIAYGILMRRNRCVHKCLMLICNEHITSVERIAEILGISPEKAGILLKKVIDAGLLEGASLPENSDELVFTKSIWAHQHVVCENCGAELFVNLGQTLTCAYCGGALKARRIRDASFS